MNNSFIPESDSGICTHGPTPNVVVGYFCKFLAWHFSNANNIQDPALKGFIWKSDKNVNNTTGVINTAENIQSKILIEPVTKYTPNTAMQRPAIVVKRNTISTKRLSIGDEVHSLQNLYGEVDPNVIGIAGDIQTMFGLESSCSMICVGANGATVEALGYEVWNALITHVPILKDELMLADFQVMQLEGIGKLEEDREMFALPVTVAYSYVIGKILRYEAPTLKGFIYEIGES